MEKKFKIITLCGSSRFKEEFIKIQRNLAAKGNIVLSLDFFSKSELYDLNQDELDHLREIHNEKIRLSDAIFVINVGGYIGKSTAEEIEYANSLNKEIIYLEDNNSVVDECDLRKLINMYCPFCKTCYGGVNEDDLKKSITITCNICKRRLVMWSGYKFKDK